MKDPDSELYKLGICSSIKRQEGISNDSQTSIIWLYTENNLAAGHFLHKAAQFIICRIIRKENRCKVEKCLVMHPAEIKLKIVCFFFSTISDK